MAKAGRSISVTNNDGAGTTVLHNNTTSIWSVLVKNNDSTNAVQLLGTNDDGTQQTYGNGYDWGAGVEYGFDLFPNESIVAAAAPSTTVLVSYYRFREHDE